MPVLELHLVSVLLEEPEIERHYVGVLGRCCAAVSYCPVVPIEFGHASPGITSGIRSKVIRSICQEPEAQKSLSGIDTERVPVEEVEDTEITCRQDKSPLIVGRTKLQW